jgi:hypothetical protein
MSLSRCCSSSLALVLLGHHSPVSHMRSPSLSDPWGKKLVCPVYMPILNPNLLKYKVR